MSLKKGRKCVNTSICRFHLVVLSVFISHKGSTFFFFSSSSYSNLSSSGSSHVNSQKSWLVRYLIRFAPYSGLIDGVTATECWVQGGSTAGRIFATFKRRFVTNRFRSCCVLFYNYDIPISRSSHVNSQKGWLVTYLIRFAPYSGLIDDVTATECWVQGGSTDGRIFCRF